jgi:hypothetical protein
MLKNSADHPKEAPCRFATSNQLWKSQQIQETALSVDNLDLSEWGLYIGQIRNCQNNVEKFSRSSKRGALIYARQRPRSDLQLSKQCCEILQIPTTEASCNIKSVVKKSTGPKNGPSVDNLGLCVSEAYIGQICNCQNSVEKFSRSSNSAVTDLSQTETQVRFVTVKTVLKNSADPQKEEQ